MSRLKCWLRKINKQDKISKEELNEIFNRLDGHDKAIREDERRRFAEWFDEETCCDDLFTFDDVMTLISKYEQMKGGAE